VSERRGAPAGKAPKAAKRRSRSKAPRKLRFTREGRVFLLVTLGVGAAAVNTGNNLLYLVLGLLLSMIVLSGILSEVVLRHVRVRRRLPRRAFAGSPCLVELEVINDKTRAPSYSVELEDVVEGDATTEGRCYFLKVSPSASASGGYRLIPGRRGALPLTGVKVRTKYPFGLFDKWRVIELADELLVYPALAPDAPAQLTGGVTGREVPSQRTGAGTEVAGLREYRDGDEARSIHWRRSASLGRMIVRERHRDASRRVTLAVDERRPDGAGEAWDARFEAMLSSVAAVAAQTLEAGAAVEVVARGSSSPLVLPGQPPDPVWRFLARLEPIDPGDADEASPPAEAARRFEVGAA